MTGVFQKSLLLMLVAIASCSKPFPEASLFSWFTLLSSLDPYVFVTGSTYSGDLRTAGGGATGIDGADRLCAAAKDAELTTLPGTGNDYRAVLVDGANRVACTTVNCGTGIGENVNWVLKANTTYKRPDGAVVFTTNSSGIFLLASGIQSPLASSGQWWTGLDADWNDVGTACTGWITTAGNGFFGVGGAVDSTAITDGAFGTACTGSRSLLCARQ